MVGGNGAMAQRKGVVTGKVAMVVCVVILLGLLMGSRIFLTNQITGLRTRVADLENQKEYLEASSAKLHLKWNDNANGEIIVARAERELGLIVPREPGLVLVCLGKHKESKSTFEKLWAGFPVREEASELVAEAMVSLVPRGARAGTVEGPGE